LRTSRAIMLCGKKTRQYMRENGNAFVL